MAFSDFKNIFEVSEKYNTVIDKGEIFLNIPTMSLPDLFMEDLRYSLSTKKPNSSEIAICENLIS